MPRLPSLRRALASIFRYRPGRKSERKPGRLSFSRHIIQPPAEQRRLIQELEGKLKNPDFFNGLPSLKSSSVKRFEFNGVSVAIKNTKGNIPPGSNIRQMHGYDFNSFRKTLLAHQEAVRNKGITASRYKLKSIKVYGRIGNFLVMEFVESPSRGKVRRELNAAVRKSLDAATAQLESNLGKLTRDYTNIPQETHLMVVGNSNPKYPDKGQWVFFLPYD